MDQKKGGDVAALLAVLTFILETTRDEKRDEMARVGISDTELLALEKVIQIFKGGIALGQGLTKVNTPDQFATFRQWKRGRGSQSNRRMLYT